MSDFAVTWDYRCPFARNAHEHLVAGLEAGAPWDVRFAAFSLNQVHVAEGGLDVWDDPAQAANLRAMQVGIVVRHRFPELFRKVHVALFKARHDEGRDIRDGDVLRAVLTEQGADADAVFAEIEDGWPLDAFRKEHEQLVNDHQVFGVPTFIAEDQAVFVRLMDRPSGDGELARRTIERVLDLVTGWPELNEFKHTSVRR
ncbi:MAG TPA: DsbA family protein [Acidimicrobiales bacterium]|nr:DsbA family protein [Acidimicrobiales bacterium]